MDPPSAKRPRGQGGGEAAAGATGADATPAWGLGLRSLAEFQAASAVHSLGRAGAERVLRALAADLGLAVATQPVAAAATAAAAADDDDDCVIIDQEPPPLRAAGGGAAAGGGNDGAVGGSGGGARDGGGGGGQGGEEKEEEDIQLMGVSGPVVTADWPHARSDCAVHAFTKRPLGAPAPSPNLAHCPKVVFPLGA